MGCAAVFPSTPKYLFLFSSESGLRFLAVADQGSLEHFQLMKGKNKM